jgi:hypothetical protein
MLVEVFTSCCYSAAEPMSTNCIKNVGYVLLVCPVWNRAWPNIHFVILFSLEGAVLRRLHGPYATLSVMISRQILSCGFGLLPTMQIWHAGRGGCAANPCPVISARHIATHCPEVHCQQHYTDDEVRHELVLVDELA